MPAILFFFPGDRSAVEDPMLWVKRRRCCDGKETSLQGWWGGRWRKQRGCCWRPICADEGSSVASVLMTETWPVAGWRGKICQRSWKERQRPVCAKDSWRMRKGTTSAAGRRWVLRWEEVVKGTPAAAGGLMEGNQRAWERVEGRLASSGWGRRKSKREGLCVVG